MQTEQDPGKNHEVHHKTEFQIKMHTTATERLLSESSEGDHSGADPPTA